MEGNHHRQQGAEQNRVGDRAVPGEGGRGGNEENKAKKERGFLGLMIIELAEPGNQRKPAGDPRIALVDAFGQGAAQPFAPDMAPAAQPAQPAVGASQRQRESRPGRNSKTSRPGGASGSGGPIGSKYAPQRTQRSSWSM